MSCMMTDTKELTVLAAYVTEILEGADKMGTIEGVKRINPPEALGKVLAECRIEKGMWDVERVYERLYRLNEAAYCGHYGEKKAKVIPKRIPNLEVPTDDETMKVWATKLWNLLRFYNYQCAEDANYGSELCKALGELQNTLAGVIANFTAKELGLGWGCW